MEVFDDRTWMVREESRRYFLSLRDADLIRGQLVKNRSLTYESTYRILKVWWRANPLVEASSILVKVCISSHEWFKV